MQLATLRLRRDVRRRAAERVRRAGCGHVLRRRARGAAGGGRRPAVVAAGLRSAFAGVRVARAARGRDRAQPGSVGRADACRGGGGPACEVFVADARGASTRDHSDGVASVVSALERVRRATCWRAKRRRTGSSLRIVAVGAGGACCRLAGFGGAAVRRLRSHLRRRPGARVLRHGDDSRHPRCACAGCRRRVTERGGAAWPTRPHRLAQPGDVGLSRRRSACSSPHEGRPQSLRARSTPGEPARRRAGDRARQRLPRRGLRARSSRRSRRRHLPARRPARYSRIAPPS